MREFIHMNFIHANLYFFYIYINLVAYANMVITPRTLKTNKQLRELIKKCHHINWFVPGKIIKINDKMQYGKYKLTARYGKDFDPEFKPELTPVQMLRLGVFEGKYLNDCVLEFPREWFSRTVLNKMSPEGPNVSLNYYKIKSRLPLQEWRRKNWIGFTVKDGNYIYHDPDVRGWFQWYCRYYIGRRIPQIDKIQINRWRAFTRHLAQLRKHCSNKPECRPKQRQALIQWAYDARRI